MAQLAQVTVARMRAPLDDPAMRGFVEAVGAVHALAVGSPGFVWQVGDGHGVGVVTEDGGPAFLTVSVWRDYPALHAFTYRSAHGRFVRERARWFVRTRAPSTALWWVADGTTPDVQEATRRLRHLRDHGPTPGAFGLKRRFTPSGVPERAARRHGV